MSKSCEEVKEMLSPYIDDVLSEAETRNCREHLASCEACRKEYEFLQGLVKTAGNLPSCSLSTSFHEELHDRLLVVAAEKKAAKQKMRLLRQLTSGFAAAAAMVVLSVVTFSNLPKQTQLTPTAPPTELTQEKTEQNENRPAIEKQPKGETQKPSNVNEIITPEETKEPADALHVSGDISKEPEVASELQEEAPPKDVEQSGGRDNDMRAGAPFIKTAMHYSLKEESYLLACGWLSEKTREGDGFLIPDEELMSLCQALEDLPGYVSHRNAIENLKEPTQEEVNLYSKHTLLFLAIAE